jgi:alkylation response protein AidB-like acyl-CoA dehydrogenase
VTGRHADAGADTHVEAELAKLFASEKTWQVADELLQIRGGRGYETAESASARGERGVPVEQLLRDVRIGRIFDGSTEALRGFIAQEALGLAPATADPVALEGPLAPHLRFVERTCRSVAQHFAHGRTRWGTELEERQLFLGRLVDITAELYAMSVSCVYAKETAAIELADAFCHQARLRIAELFGRLWSNTDDHDRAVARGVLGDRYTWLEDGILDPSIEGPWIAEPALGPSELENLHRRVV